MECHRKMDAAGPSRKRRALIVFLLCPLYLTAQTPPSNAQFIEHAHQLLNEQRWQEVVEILQSAHPRYSVRSCQHSAIARAVIDSFASSWSGNLPHLFR